MKQNVYKSYVIVRTNKGVVTFVNLDAYTAALTAGNILNKLDPATKPNGYYILKNNVTADLQARTRGNFSTGEYFSGTFDGRGNKLSATVSGYGIFGMIAGGALIENTSIELTFGNYTTTPLAHTSFSNLAQYCSGLAGNDDASVENQNIATRDTLKNLYITTTNYKDNCFVLMAVKPYFLKMEDVYIKLSGVAGSYSYTNAKTQRGVLFGADRNGSGRSNSDTAMSEIATGRLIKNVYVVTTKFMALSAALDQVEGTDRWTVWYADNDVLAGKLGTVGRRGNAVKGSTMYLQIYNNNSNTSKDNLFGTGYESSKANPKFSDNPFTCANPYIERYDTRPLTLTKVGNWSTLTGAWQA